MFIELLPIPPPKMKIKKKKEKIFWKTEIELLPKEKLNFCRSALFHMKTRVGLKYFLNDCGYSHMDLDGFIPVAANSR